MWTSKWGKEGFAATVQERQQLEWVGGEWETHWESLGERGGIGAIPSRKDPVPFPSIRRNTICDILPKW